jgi:hypothetical protein
MRSTTEEYRHAALMAAIVAVVPLLFYPHNLGLQFNLSPFAFMLLELIYYWLIFAIFAGGMGARNIFVAGSICFFLRLGIGVVFALLVLLMHETSLREAFASGLYKYKPAMLLQVVSFPFIVMPIMKGIFTEKTPKPRVVIGGPQPMAAETRKPAPRSENIAERKIIGLKTQINEKPFTGFDEALKYLGEMAAVQFAVLIDKQGLPVSFFGPNKATRDLWAAIGIFLADKIKEPLVRAGEYALESFELTLDVCRVHVVRIEPLYLLVAANREGGETEKVRIAHVANMIRKIYNERYEAKPEISTREGNYVPSLG